MASTSVPRPSGFVASELLARLALQAGQYHDKPQAVGTVRVWVSYLREAVFVDEAALLAPGPERFDATPEGLPGPDEKDIVLRTQQAIGTRVERLLSNYAFEAAARKEREAPVTDGQRFVASVYQAILKSLPIASSKAEPVLECLMNDLRKAAQNQTLSGDWGALREGPEGLYLAIAGPLERLPADRPRARVVGGIAKQR